MIFTKAWTSVFVIAEKSALAVREVTAHDIWHHNLPEFFTKRLQALFFLSAALLKAVFNVFWLDAPVVQWIGRILAEDMM